jgi:hypothetical protein
MGMKTFARIAMAAIVIVHFGNSMIHRTSHTSAHVPLSPAANIFVFTALTLIGSLVSGFVNHFVLASPDHISQVDMQWRPLFGTTAVLLVITEALGIGLAVRPLR